MKVLNFAPSYINMYKQFLFIQFFSILQNFFDQQQLKDIKDINRSRRILCVLKSINDFNVYSKKTHGLDYCLGIIKK